MRAAHGGSAGKWIVPRDRVSILQCTNSLNAQKLSIRDLSDIGLGAGDLNRSARSAVYGS